MGWQEGAAQTSHSQTGSGFTHTHFIKLHMEPNMIKRLSLQVHGEQLEVLLIRASLNVHKHDCNIFTAYFIWVTSPLIK